MSPSRLREKEALGTRKKFTEDRINILNGGGYFRTNISIFFEFFKDFN
jgi:hypothetical protein